MKLVSMGLSGVRVSELCLGAMNFGNPAFGVDESHSLEVLGAYFEAGGNFIDTANAYTGGVSEQIVGKAVQGRRDQVVIATKGFFPPVAAFGDPPPHPNALGSSRRHLTEALEASLKRLGTDYVDLYQVHCWDPMTPLEETLSSLDGFVKTGKVRYVGLSNYSAWQIAEARMLCKQYGWEPFVTAQMQYSLICRSIEDDVVPVCERYGIGVLPWSPLGQGVLTGKYGEGKPGPEGSRFADEPTSEMQAAWRNNFLNERSFEVARAAGDAAVKLGSTSTAVSLAWLLSRPAVSSIIIGPKSVEQLKQNLAAAELELPGDVLETLNTVSAPTPRYPEAFIKRTQRATD